MLKRAMIVWCALLLIAVANGAFREAVLIPRYSNIAAHQISTLMLSIAILLLAYFTIRWIGPVTVRDTIVAGTTWLVMTLVFEFGFGLAQGKSMDVLLADYDIMAGRVWPVVLLVTFLAPWMAARIRGILVAT